MWNVSVKCHKCVSALEKIEHNNSKMNKTKGYKLVKIKTERKKNWNRSTTQCLSNIHRVHVNECVQAYNFHMQRDGIKIKLHWICNRSESSQHINRIMAYVCGYLLCSFQCERIKSAIHVWLWLCTDWAMLYMPSSRLHFNSFETNGAAAQVK